MCDLPKFQSEQLLVGFESSDDAAVYEISASQAIIQTLDFFTPIVDDPYTFGAIAAANALSDVYAMGGTPVLAMNIVGFPNFLSPSILKSILHGGSDKVKEAQALLVGGHSIEDDEPKYGLSVMGQVHPKRIWKNIGARPGDVLLLTKPLGIGILTTALKAELLSPVEIDEISNVMMTLNKVPTVSFIAEEIDVHACTDITGFGLLGHATEMARGSNVTIVIESSHVPYIEKAKTYAEMGIIPGGAYKNRDFVKDTTVYAETCEDFMVDLLCDPQTSGGLLFALPKEAVDAVTKILIKEATLPYAFVGYVIDKQPFDIEVK